MPLLLSQTPLSMLQKDRHRSHAVFNIIIGLEQGSH